MSAPPPYDPKTMGGYIPEESYIPVEDNVGFNSLGFDSNEVRRLFIRKVYSILSIQLIVTALIIAAFVSSEAVQEYMNEDGEWLIYTCAAVFIITYMCLVCPCCNFQRKYPLNIILLIFMTLALSITAGVTASYYSTKVVLLAAGTTATVVVLITGLTFWSKFDITKFWYIGLAGSLAFILVWPIMLIVGYSNILYTLYCGFAVMLFTFYLAYDTKVIIGGGRDELSPDDHIEGVVQLYVDIVYIFLYLLRIFGTSD